ncbi:MAG: Uncharacterized protein JWQ90_5063 [Hydrocarboniphaga sp.]|uniref:hypothetical protein n=1 Tax=Hydrocarboniphaga sp. TaxID=2033016 RepID=UPI00261FB779|nr:hypothetical protein [Hydrocarboniphaga sp.]MDB5972613.1 Uncharacterized protein [Hydrocarboniphaga sp.]
MTAERITLVVDGLEKDNGDVRLEVFVEELQKLQAALARADKTSSGGKRRSYFAVVGLSHSSPATVELEARYTNGVPYALRGQAFSHFFGLIDSVENGVIPDDVDYGLLEDLRALSAPVGTKLRAATLKIDSRIFSLTEKIAKKIDEHMADQEHCFSTVEGTLEKINIHAEANAFTIYPDVGAKRIACHFPPSLVDKAISAVSRRIAVTGLCAYRKFADFPHHINVDDIEIYHSEDQLANFDDILGLAPGLTVGTTSEALIREIRNGWE